MKDGGMKLFRFRTELQRAAAWASIDGVCELVGKRLAAVGQIVVEAD